MALKEIFNIAIGGVHLDCGLIKPGESKVVHESLVLGGDIQDALRKGWIRIEDAAEIIPEDISLVEAPEPIDIDAQKLQ